MHGSSIMIAFNTVSQMSLDRIMTVKITAGV